MNDNEYHYFDPSSARVQETVQMGQVSPRVTTYQPLVLGDSEDLNSAEIRAIREQEFIGIPKSEQGNNLRSESNKKIRICFRVLNTICWIFFFSLAAVYICESIIKKQQNHDNRLKYLILSDLFKKGLRWNLIKN